MKGFVIWFTGLSGAGKSTLTALVATELRRRGVHVEVLDGDEVRNSLSKGLGFSREDRDENVLRIGFVAKLVARSGACAMTATISPYRATRDAVRATIDRFVEVYVTSPMEELVKRDPKGLYEKALRGEIANMTGVSDPYEPPIAPEVEIDTSKLDKADCVARILATLERLGLLAGSHEPSLPFPHGGELAIPAETVSTDVRASIALDAHETEWLGWIARGFLSPVRGFLGARDGSKVRNEGRLETGVHFPIDLALVRHDEALVHLSKGDTVELVLPAAPGVPSVAPARMDLTEVDTTDAGTRLGGTVVAAGGLGASLVGARAVRERASELVRGTIRPRICGLVGNWGAESQASLALSMRMVEAVIRFGGDPPGLREIVLPPPPRVGVGDLELQREDVLIRAIVLKNAGATHVALPRALDAHVPREDLVALDLDVLVL